jgi:hypothetical protein
LIGGHHPASTCLDEEAEHPRCLIALTMKIAMMAPT